MNSFEITALRKFVAGEAMDEWTGRKHADGSICKASSPESCPFEKKAEAGDRIESAESSRNQPVDPDELAKKYYEIRGRISKAEDAQRESLEKELSDFVEQNPEVVLAEPDARYDLNAIIKKKNKPELNDRVNAAAPAYEKKAKERMDKINENRRFQDAYWRDYVKANPIKGVQG